jgi:hypothetical protein
MSREQANRLWLPPFLGPAPSDIFVPGRQSTCLAFSLVPILSITPPLACASIVADRRPHR